MFLFFQAAIDFMSRGHMLPDVVALIGKFLFRKSEQCVRLSFISQEA